MKIVARDLQQGDVFCNAHTEDGVFDVVRQVGADEFLIGWTVGGRTTTPGMYKGDTPVAVHIARLSDFVISEPELPP